MLSWLARASLIVLALAVTTSVAAQQRTSVTSRPNIVLILMDDLGYGDLGSYGVPDAKTPNIDRLAREGVRLTDFYANAANCSPTRTAFITGRYQQRYGIEWQLIVMSEDSARGLLPSETSLPRMLKNAGYRTGLIGKWHLGWQPQFRPNLHGFDEFWGFLGGAVDYHRHVDAFGRHDLYHNGNPTTHNGYITDEIASRASAFIADRRGEPFFLEVAFNATHWPFQSPVPDEQPRAMRDSARHGRPLTPLERVEELREGTREDYVAILERADRGVGAILATLDRLNLTRNTLVIFTSDNGGEWLSRNAPLFHRKSTLWEGGIRVPAIVRWPARLPAGVESKQVGLTMDLTASILAAAGVTPPASYQAEGMNLIPLLAEQRVVERTLFWRLQTAGRFQRAMRRGRWKYLRGSRAGGAYEFLFDLEADVGERHDLTATHAEMLPEFRKAVASWEADVDSNRAVPARAP